LRHKKLECSKDSKTSSTLWGNGPGSLGWQNQTGMPGLKKSWTIFGLLVMTPTQFAMVDAVPRPHVHGS